MKKCFLISGMLLFYSCSPIWAMDEDEHKPLLQAKPMSVKCLAPEGLNLLQEELSKLLTSQSAAQGNLGPFLNLEPLSSEQWPEHLKKYCKVQPHQYRLRDWMRYTASLITTGFVQPPPKLAILYVGLQELNLSNTRPIDPDGQKLLRGILKRAPQLTTLNLSHNEVDGGWVKNVLIVGSLSLQHLDLSHNKIRGEDELQLHCTYRGFPNLKTLNLSYNQLGTSSQSKEKVRWVFGSARFSGQSLRPSTFQMLNLEGNPVAEDNPSYGSQLLNESSLNLSLPLPWVIPSRSRFPHR